MAIGKLTLGSNVECDFITITQGAVPSNVGELTYEPAWDANSKFLAKFDNTLRTGNLKADGTPPTSWAIYRQKVGTETMDYVMTIEGAEPFCFDYMPANNAEYMYHSFARTDSDMSEDKRSKPIKTNWGAWTLFTLDETDEAGVYIPNQIFMFQYNLEIGDLSNNTNFNRLETFTRFPIIQRSSSNYLSGQLKGLTGLVDCSGRYADTVSQADALQTLTTDARRKILKDMKGHVMEVELSGSMVFSVIPNMQTEPYYATLQWSEVGNANDIRIVVNGE